MNTKPLFLVGTRVYYFGIGYGYVTKVRTDDVGDYLFDVQIDTWAHETPADHSGRMVARAQELKAIHAEQEAK